MKHKSILYALETWRPIRYKNIKNIYEISNYGRVRNVNTQKILKSYKCHKDDDHLSISLMIKKKYHGKPRSSDKRKTFSIHVLVAVTYIPNPENKPIVHHKDGDPSNNEVNNLMWVTASEHQVLTYELEQRDRKFGEKSPNAKYTTEQYTELAKLMEQNCYTVSELSELTGISVNMIRSFINGDVVWPDARKYYDVSKYDKKQSIDIENMEKAFQLASMNKYSVKEISRLSGVKTSTVSNIVNHSVSKKWDYLYDKYVIPESTRSKPIIVISDKVTRDVIKLLKSGKTPIEIISIMDLPENKAIYGKIYRLSRKYK